MKIVIIKEMPNSGTDSFIKKVKEDYDGIVTKLNYMNKFKELSEKYSKKNYKLFSKILNLGKDLEDIMFRDLMNILDRKTSNELVFIHINDEDKIQKLQEKYQTVSIEEFKNKAL